jgi:hypothetical protein
MAKEDKDLASVVDLLIDKIAALQGSGGGLTTEQLDKLLEKTAGTTAEAFRSALIPENKVHPGISVFSYPEGDLKHPKPRLDCDTIFCGHRQREDNLTPEEIIAANALGDGQVYEARSGFWKAHKGKNGTKDILIIHCDEAVDRDRARDLPPMLHVLVELKNGPQAVDLAALTRQLNAMKLQLDQAVGVRG